MQDTCSTETLLELVGSTLWAWLGSEERSDLQQWFWIDDISTLLSTLPITLLLDCMRPCSLINVFRYLHAFSTPVSSQILSMPSAKDALLLWRFVEAWSTFRTEIYRIFTRNKTLDHFLKKLYWIRCCDSSGQQMVNSNMELALGRGSAVEGLISGRDMFLPLTQRDLILKICFRFFWGK